VVHLGADVLGAFDQHLGHARVLPDVIEQRERRRCVAAPQACAERLARLFGSERIEAHELGLMEELIADAVVGLAVPASLGVGQRDTQVCHGIGDLLANVQTVGELAAEDADVLVGLVDLDDVFARERNPIDGAALLLLGHDQRSHAAALGDDVRLRQRPLQEQALVDVVQDERAIRCFDARR
jgi:hypothetical protein